jgi:hypothetical protein
VCGLFERVQLRHVEGGIMVNPQLSAEAARHFITGRGTVLPDWPGTPDDDVDGDRALEFKGTGEEELGRNPHPPW